MLQLLLSFVLVLSATSYEATNLPPAEKRNAIVKMAKSLISSKYKYGGKGPRQFDCSGFTQFVFKKSINVNLAPSSKLQSKQGVSIKKKDALPGDLIFFKRSGKVNHVGLIYKVDKSSLWVIHSTSSKGVILEDLNKSAYWKNKISSIKRVF